MRQLSQGLQDKLAHFALALIDQQQARVVVPPLQPDSGFWFGGGNLIALDDGALCLVGRYRNAGDSRTGLAAGERGLQLAIWTSRDRGESFTKALSFDKADLSCGRHSVLSIEGSAIVETNGNVELFVSVEKDGVGYPAGFEDHLKPGTGVWSVDRRSASSIDGLRDAEQQTVPVRDRSAIYPCERSLCARACWGRLSAPVLQSPLQLVIVQYGICDSEEWG